MEKAYSAFPQWRTGGPIVWRSPVAAIVLFAVLLGVVLAFGLFVAPRQKVWTAIVRLEAETRALGPVVEETRDELPTPPKEAMFRVGTTMVPRADFVETKFQDSMCMLRTDDWSAYTVHLSPMEVSGGVTIAARMGVIQGPELGWFEAMTMPYEALGNRLALAMFDKHAGRLDRVIRTPSRKIALTTSMSQTGQRNVLLEIDGGRRWIVWTFRSRRGALDDELLVDWARQVQY